jgi:hypothetical protein
MEEARKKNLDDSSTLVMDMMKSSVIIFAWMI